MTKLHTPAQAAQITGVSRSKVSRALKDGVLRGVRNNSGHWRISDDDLNQWMTVQPHTVPAQIEAGQGEQIARLETENRMLRELVEEVRASRDDWKAQANRRWWDFLLKR